MSSPDPVVLCEVIPAVQFVILVIPGQVTPGPHQAKGGAARGIQQPDPEVTSQSELQLFLLISPT